MPETTEIAVAAINRVARNDLDQEDRHAPGVYWLEVPKAAPPALKAAIALDVFHCSRPIGTLDDFAFIVFDPKTGLVMDQGDDYDAYANSHQGHNFQRISDRLPHLYSVSIAVTGKEGAGTTLGSITVVADNKSKAIDSAHALLWNAKLDSAGFTPRHVANRLKLDQL